MTTVLNMQDPHVRLMWQLLQQRAALRIEVATGLSHSRGSVMALIRREQTVIPNAFQKLSPHTVAGPGGVLEYPDGTPYYATISHAGTKIRVLEDIDARVVMLGGTPLTWDVKWRKGSTDKINAAAERRHERRIAAVQALLGDV